MTLKLSLAFVLAFIIALIVGRFYIPWLRKMKAGQEIKEIGPSWHMAKTGTPTMGGFIFIFAAAVVCLTVGFSSMRNGDYAHIFILLFALVFGAIGFLDDWEKLRKKQNLGLSAKAKFLLQLVAALVFVLLMRKLGYLSTHLYIPFWNVEVPIPDAVYFILAAFIIVGTGQCRKHHRRRGRPCKRNIYTRILFLYSCCFPLGGALSVARHFLLGYARRLTWILGFQL